MATYGLLGYPLSHSFSRGYFTEKFARMGLSDTHRYLNFELKEAIQMKKKLEEYSDLIGFNITIPHKQAIIPLLDTLDPVAARIGAVNTVRVEGNRLTGYNTDWIGFRDTLLPQMRMQGYPIPGSETKALVLGTGGSSLAVRETLRQLGVEFQSVSRSSGPGVITYADLTPALLRDHLLIVNTTPLGMSPDTDSRPDLPYAALTPGHFCYDLVYNPRETTFLRLAGGAGAGAANGIDMLHRQAEASWAIWNAV